MSSNAIVEQYEALKARQQELQTKIAAIHADFKRGLDPDASDRAIELENAEVLNEILRVTEKELASVNEALLRLRGELPEVEESQSTI
jgi:RNA polymerase-binding transcription factor DksA